MTKVNWHFMRSETVALLTAAGRDGVIAFCPTTDEVVCMDEAGHVALLVGETMRMRARPGHPVVHVRNPRLRSLGVSVQEETAWTLQETSKRTYSDELPVQLLSGKLAQLPLVFGALNLAPATAVPAMSAKLLRAAACLADATGGQHVLFAGDSDAEGMVAFSSARVLPSGKLRRWTLIGLGTRVGERLSDILEKERGKES